MKTEKILETKLLEIENLSVNFQTEQGKIEAAKAVSLGIRKGEAVAIVGESGAGKSQLFHAVMGLQAKNASSTGSIKFLGKELLNKSDALLNNYRGTDISIIFQDPMTALNPYLKVGRQLTEVLQVHNKLSYKKAKIRAIKCLSEVKIPQADKRFEQYPHQLSGGMRQRVMIAMSLLGQPKLIIADEPTTALDVTVQTEIISLLRKEHEDNQTSIVLITHDIPLVAGLCDRIIIMYAGRIVEMGTVTEIHKLAKHPYTRALLEATPTEVAHEQKDQKLITIPGQPPLPGEKIKGCAFSPRCHLADKICKSENPPMLKITPSQSVACFHSEQLK
ncbi:MAG: ABC transporter ATP-binding protein [Thiotrichaceae bacterium]